MSRRKKEILSNRGKTQKIMKGFKRSKPGKDLQRKPIRKEENNSQLKKMR